MAEDGRLFLAVEGLPSIGLVALGRHEFSQERNPAVKFSFDVDREKVRGLKLTVVGSPAVTTLQRSD